MTEEKHMKLLQQPGKYHFDEPNRWMVWPRKRDGKTA